MTSPNKNSSIAKFAAIVTLNVWFYFWAPFVLAGSLLVYFPFVAAVRIFRPSETMRCFRRCINLYGVTVALTAWPWIRVRVSGMPPKDSAPYVFVENHTSSFDPFVQGFLPFELVQAARGWALGLPILGFLAKLAGYIDVDAMPPEEVMERSSSLLESGVSMVFFPEGTRRFQDEGLGPFHGTAFRVACANKVQIAPVVLIGIHDKPRKGSLFMRPGVIDIRGLP
ncbi:MAG: 1-acyl-sn-glycerol-3-phosphate acyltransferase, partial [Kiritimatiellaeota bacterium]|nr:1-acyl-sn-glycerol-3-phosphate acyltransferase [Kiritimatiellota bacterium]